MQGQSRVLDDLAKFLTNAAGAAQGVKQEIETLVRHQAERFISDLDLVTRDEFEVLRTMALQLAKDHEKLSSQVLSLEQTIAKLTSSKTMDGRPKRS